MVKKIFVTLVVLFAVLMGLIVTRMPRDQLVTLLPYRDFFDVSLPILAFGALIKYLVSCHHRFCCCQGKKECGSGMDKSCR